MGRRDEALCNAALAVYFAGFMWNYGATNGFIRKPVTLRHYFLLDNR